MARETVHNPVNPEDLEPEEGIGLAEELRRDEQFGLYDSYLALVRRATEAFGDPLTASRWLSVPSKDYGGQTPLKIAQQNSYSLHDLEAVFARIEHGIDF